MLQVSLSRLGAMWPHATIQILGDDPEHLPPCSSHTRVLPTKGRSIWFRQSLFFRGNLELYRPGLDRQRAWALEHYLRRRWPSIIGRLLRLRLDLRGRDSEALKEYLEAVSTADVMVVTGMGGISDAFPAYALELLECMSLAISNGAAVVMFSQGIGPLNDPYLRARAADVLSKVRFIALREDRAGGPLLRALGVEPNRVLTTGDDAIDLAYQARSKRLGSGLGVNVRASSYAEVDREVVRKISITLQEASRTHGTPIVPVPISHVPGEEDAATLRELVASSEGAYEAAARLDTPLKVIAQVQRCRLVITGSYHAGVFALSSGVPVIGLAKSQYYVDKFQGLANQFGIGCEVVLLDDDFARRLADSIERTWNSADEVRPHLLAAAARQIELSRAGYKRVYELVADTRSKASFRQKIKDPRRKRRGMPEES